MSDFKQLLANLLKARFPYLYIATYEEERVVSTIRQVASDPGLIRTPRTVLTWALTTGICGDDQKPRQDTKAPLRALEFIEKFDEPAVFVVKDFHVYFGQQGRPADFEVIRKIRDLVPVLKQSARPKNVVLISPSLILPGDLQKDVTILDFDLPGFTEIQSVLQEMIAANRPTGRVSLNLSPEDTERLAKAALGLTLQEAENAFARAIVSDGQLSINDLDVILEEKRQIIQKTEILEFVKSDVGLADVGGLGNLKRWLRKRDKSWLDSARRYNLPPPKGLLITGVPGCGKSLTAKAISVAWQLPLLRLDVGKIFSGIVGSSEENMRRAIKTAEAIAPSVLWIDEIEKGFTGTSSSGDSGTSGRVFGTFLTWLQEKTRPVFVVATSNNIQYLPPELLRKGRFDEIFFVDLPTLKERVDIFRLHLARRLTDPAVTGDFSTSDETLSDLAKLTEGFVGAEIEQVVVTGLFEAFSEDRSVTMDDFRKAIANTVPLSVTQGEQIRTLRDWASVRAVAATPSEDRAEYAEPSAGPPGDVTASRGGRMVDI